MSSICSVQQQMGRGTVFQVSYLGALGRQLPNFLDLNLDPTTMTTSNDHGRRSERLPVLWAAATGRSITVPTYTRYGNAALFGRPLHGGRRELRCTRTSRR